MTMISGERIRILEKNNKYHLGFSKSTIVESHDGIASDYFIYDESLWSSKYFQTLIWYFQSSLFQKNCIFEVKHFYFTLRFLYKELISSLREFTIRRTLLSVANTVQEDKNAYVSLTKLLTLPVLGVCINCSVIAFVTKVKTNADLPTFSIVQDNL